jgi:alpha-galactosidase/6-phospho-beta-glucosidase family protein
MRAIADDWPTTLILNVRNAIGLSGLDSEAVVEVPCFVDGNGARPLSLAPLDDHQAGLVASVKAAERATIAAAVSGSRRSALHPLVDSVAWPAGCSTGTSPSTPNWPTCVSRPAPVVAASGRRSGRTVG